MRNRYNLKKNYDVNTRNVTQAHDPFSTGLKNRKLTKPGNLEDCYQISQNSKSVRLRYLVVGRAKRDSESAGPKLVT